MTLPTQDELEILRALAQTGKARTKEIAQAMGYWDTPSRFVLKLKALVGKGFVELDPAVPGKGMGKAHRWEITDLGKSFAGVER